MQAGKREKAGVPGATAIDNSSTDMWSQKLKSFTKDGENNAERVLD